MAAENEEDGHGRQEIIMEASLIPQHNNEQNHKEQLKDTGLENLENTCPSSNHETDDTMVEIVSSEQHEKENRPNQDVRPPTKEFLPVLVDVWNKMSPEIRHAYRIFRDMMSEKNKLITEPFLDAVDSTIPELSDYYDVIKDPIDLFQISEKFHQMQYTSITELAADLRQMIENCYRYNGLDAYVSKLAFKLEVLLEQKLALLSRELREKTSIAATNIAQEKEFLNGLLFTSGGRRISRKPSNGESSLIALQMQMQDSLHEKEKKRQKEKVKKELNEALEAELDTWWQTMSKSDKMAELSTTWEVPSVGIFIFILKDFLNLQDLNYTEFELGTLYPEKSSLMSKIFTSLLVTPFQRSKLNQKEPMEYTIWESKVNTKVSSWYKMATSRGYEYTASLFGFDSDLFEVLGYKNPFESFRYHELALKQRMWIMKALCEAALEQDSAMRDHFGDLDYLDRQDLCLGSDSDGFSYHYFSAFGATDIRIYKQKLSNGPPLRKLKYQPIINVKGEHATKKDDECPNKEDETADKNDDDETEKQRSIEKQADDLRRIELDLRPITRTSSRIKSKRSLSPQPEKTVSAKKEKNQAKQGIKEFELIVSDIASLSMLVENISKALKIKASRKTAVKELHQSLEALLVELEKRNSSLFKCCQKARLKVMQELRKQEKHPSQNEVKERPGESWRSDDEDEESEDGKAERKIATKERGPEECGPGEPDENPNMAVNQAVMDLQNSMQQTSAVQLCNTERKPRMTDYDSRIPDEERETLSKEGRHLRKKRFDVKQLFSDDSEKPRKRQRTEATGLRRSDVTSRKAYESYELNRATRTPRTTKKDSTWLSPEEIDAFKQKMKHQRRNMPEKCTRNEKQTVKTDSKAFFAYDGLKALADIASLVQTKSPKGEKSGESVRKRKETTSSTAPQHKKAALAANDADDVTKTDANRATSTAGSNVFLLKSTAVAKNNVSNAVESTQGDHAPRNKQQGAPWKRPNILRKSKRPAETSTSQGLGGNNDETVNANDAHQIATSYCEGTASIATNHVDDPGTSCVQLLQTTKNSANSAPLKINVQPATQSSASVVAQQNNRVIVCSSKPNTSLTKSLPFSVTNHNAILANTSANNTTNPTQIGIPVAIQQQCTSTIIPRISQTQPIVILPCPQTMLHSDTLAQPIAISNQFVANGQSTQKVIVSQKPPIATISNIISGPLPEPIKGDISTTKCPVTTLKSKLHAAALKNLKRHHNKGTKIESSVLYPSIVRATTPKIHISRGEVRYHSSPGENKTNIQIVKPKIVAIAEPETVSSSPLRGNAVKTDLTLQPVVSASSSNLTPKSKIIIVSSASQQNKTPAMATLVSQTSKDNNGSVNAANCTNSNSVAVPRTKNIQIVKSNRNAVQKSTSDHVVSSTAVPLQSNAATPAIASKKTVSIVNKFPLQNHDVKTVSMQPISQSTGQANQIQQDAVKPKQALLIPSTGLGSANQTASVPILQISPVPMPIATSNPITGIGGSVVKPLAQQVLVLSQPGNVTQNRASNSPAADTMHHSLVPASLQSAKPIKDKMNTEQASQVKEELNCAGDVTSSQKSTHMNTNDGDMKTCFTTSPNRSETGQNCGSNQEIIKPDINGETLGLGLNIHVE
eukprot:gene16659-18349_t